MKSFKETAFYKKQYYKNLTLGTGTGVIITALVLLGILIGIDLYEGNRWTAFALSSIPILVVNPTAQSIINNIQNKRTGEPSDSWEIAYMGFAVIPSLMISAGVLALTTNLTLLVQSGVLLLIGAIIVLVAFRMHLGKWFKFS